MTAAVVTTSHTPDFDRFARLHASVLEHSDLAHYAFVPTSDVAHFSALGRSPGRLTVVPTADVLPRHIVTTEWLNRAVSRVPRAPGALRCAALNRRRPWPPVRGWILQQVVKLAAAERVEADTLVFVDSDSEFIRPFSAETFQTGGVTRLFRRSGGIHEGMPRHQAWHHAARRMLGLRGDSPLPHDDFIGGVTSWDSRLVRECTHRVQEVAGRPWHDVVAGTMDLSEYILYGEYVMNFSPPERRSFISDRPLSHSYWRTEPLTMESARAFVAGIEPDDVLLHVQSNSHTPPDVERLLRAAARDVTR